MRARSQGFAVPFLPAVIAVAVVLAFFIGWHALTLAVAFVAGAIAYAWWGERRAAHDPASAEALRPWADGACRSCGSAVFEVQPGKTTADEIKAFAATAEGWRDNPDAREGWMPPGVYCPRGCFAIHTTPAVEPSPASGGETYPGLEAALASFEDLYARAHETPGDDVYAAQRRLVDARRASRARFLAVMPFRHRSRCPVCGHEDGEAALHYEDPAQPAEGADPKMLFPSHAGRWCEIRRSVLHRIVAHGEPAPPSLARLVENLPAGAG